MVIRNRVFAYPGNIYIPAMNLWLDPTRKREFGFVSHAHADHAGRHQRILATAATSRLLEQRLGVRAALTLPYGEALPIGGGSVTLFPAGHILGAAQILIEHQGERLLYTGDFKLRTSRTAEPCAAVPCDHLIMECTYGLPQYRFPDRAQVEEQLLRYVASVLERGEVPVVLAYALGRAQEIIRLLAENGLRVSVERRIFEISLVYAELGVELGPFGEFDPGDCDGQVLVFPPHLWKAPVLRAIARRRTIAVTGWAVDGRHGAWYRTDASFPLSDHADFHDLLRYVEMTSPSNVYLIHGFSEFASHLASLGVNVHCLA